jgi:phosphohistidine phosphatase SixA
MFKIKGQDTNASEQFTDVLVVNSVLCSQFLRAGKTAKEVSLQLRSESWSSEATWQTLWSLHLCPG